MNTSSFRRFRTALTVTFVLSLLVVAAGATVRATGSGMGCPDWPLCYGCWIPPVSVEQLPEDYAERYAVAGRLAEFDPVKTWIEYVNRLLGAVTGLAMLVVAGLSLPLLRHRPSLGILTLAALLVLAFVAWLGAHVVDTFLAPYAVTLHLLTAYTLLALLLGARELTSRVLLGPRLPTPRPVRVALLLVGLAFFLQWTLGIRTREEIEAWIWNHDLAESVFEVLGGAYDLHKIAGFLVAGASFWLAWVARKGGEPGLARLAAVGAVLVVLQGVLGLVLWFGELPAWSKPLHLVVATLAWSAWMALVLRALPSGVSRVHV